MPCLHGRNGLRVAGTGEDVGAGASSDRARVLRTGAVDTDEPIDLYGHATACAVGLANLDLIEREGLIERVRSLEPVLERVLRPLESHPLVGEVRTVGLLAAVELAPAALAERHDLPDRVFRAALERGVISRAIRGVALQISPPFVISEAELERVAEVLGESLDAQRGAA